ncbi:MAG TPA: nucleoid occlusion protein [Virgibacillus sp.]|nr:nucleoid occlusion protein [Virgibacillus sp.]
MLHPFNRIFGMGSKSTNEQAEAYHPDEVVQIPVENITANRFQPRTIFNEERIEELAQTIQTHGMIQPIIVREIEEDRFEIIAGERRWRAVQSLEWDHISAIIREMNNTETASVALIENLQREELTVIEEASAYAQLIELHSLTQEALAQRLGKSQSTIANKLRLLKLPDEVREALLNKTITERHARALIVLSDPEKQTQMLHLILEQELNVKQTEEMVKEIRTPKEKTKNKRPLIKGVNKDIRIAMNTIKQSLSMVSDSGIDLETEEEDLETHYQITIKIPK